MNRHEARGRRGNAAVLGISLIGLLGFGALAVDMGWERVANAQLAAALDAATLGGVAYLDGTVEGVELAMERAVWIGNLNPVFVGFEITADDLVPGRYDPDARTFTPLGLDDADQINALRASDRIERFQSILAGAAFGVDSLSTSGVSLAFRPVGGVASEVPCFLPLALPTCMFPDTPIANPEPFHAVFGNNTTDNIAWAFPGNVNAKTLRDHLEDGCSAGSLSVSQNINLTNGVVSSAVDTMGQVLNGHKGSAEPWDDENLGPMYKRKKPHAFPKGQSLVNDSAWGNVLQGPVAMVDLGGEPGSCAGAANFTGTHQVKGFTWGVIYDVQAGNAQEKGFMIQFDFVTERELGLNAHPDAIGNVTAPYGRPRLVPPA